MIAQYCESVRVFKEFRELGDSMLPMVSNAEAHRVGTKVVTLHSRSTAPKSEHAENGLRALGNCPRQGIQSLTSALQFSRYIALANVNERLQDNRSLFWDMGSD